MTLQIGEAVAALTLSDLPPEVVRIARGNLLDCTGVALAAVDEPAARISREYALSLGAGLAVIWGRPERASPAAAALANGTAAHALDFDDCNQSMAGHPTAPIWPALLSLAQLHGRSGAETLTAYVAGLEVAGKIGRVLNPHHVESGWHATDTLCTLGAAVACAKLLRLDAERIAGALSIAASLAGGLRRNFGSMVKPLHSGMAAFHGLSAAELAAAGLTAHPDALSGKLGFAGVFSAGEEPESWDQLMDRWGSAWEILDPGMDIKPYPCCRATHASIDCVLHLMKTHGITADQIRQIRAGISYMRPKILVYDRPETPLQAKFSMSFCLATAAVHGGVGIGHFSAEGLADPSVQAMMPKVEMYVHPDMGPQPGVNPALELVGAEVTIHLHDGSAFSHRVKQGKGHPTVPMTDEEISAKFHLCAKALSVATRNRIAGALLGFDRLDQVDELCEALGGENGP